MNLLEDLGMADERHHHAGSLSRGNKRRLELAMPDPAPKLLLLDEPTAGMARHDTNRTIELLKKIKLRGMTKVIIEHDMHVVFSLADRISVLAQGAIIAEGAPNEIKGIKKCVRPTWGVPCYDVQTDVAPKSAPITARPFAGLLLGVGPAFVLWRELHRAGVSFDIREGEILALLGRNGAGKTSTLRTIARTDKPQMKHGEIWLDHKAIHEMPSHGGGAQWGGPGAGDRRIIPGLTVEESLDLAQIAPPKGWTRSVSTKVSPPGGTPHAGGNHHVGWRAADAGVARALRATSSCCCSTNLMRAWRRSSCGDRAHSRGHTGAWYDHDHRRAERLPRSTSRIVRSFLDMGERSYSTVPRRRCWTIRNCARSTWRSDHTAAVQCAGEITGFERLQAGSARLSGNGSASCSGVRRVSSCSVSARFMLMVSAHWPVRGQAMDLSLSARSAMAPSNRISCAAVRYLLGTE